jgi:hypothetical protein
MKLLIATAGKEGLKNILRRDIPDILKRIQLDGLNITDIQHGRGWNLLEHHLFMANACGRLLDLLFMKVSNS